MPTDELRWTKDKLYTEIAILTSRRSTCHRLSVGCVFVDGRGQVISTGYNGRGRGQDDCAHAPIVDRCKNSDAPLGAPNGCESVHAEQNALLQSGDVSLIHTCYVTHSPCMVCVKLLLNTGCYRIGCSSVYPSTGAQELWEKNGRVWNHYVGFDARGYKL